VKAKNQNQNPKNELAVAEGRSTGSKRQLSLWMDQSAHAAIKKAAAKDGRTMSKWLMHHIVKQLAEEAKAELKHARCVTPVLLAVAVAVATGTSAATIPAGTFILGDSNDRSGPVPRKVALASFVIEDNEVILSQWQAVRTWAVTNGYQINTGNSKKPNYPVYYVNWFDAVKWCNARSEQQGLVPPYEIGAHSIYRSGNFAPDVNTNANGFRLPTSDEWEAASRGGLITNRFPYGMKISEAQANYYGQTYFPYDLGPSGYNTRTKYLPMPYIGAPGMFRPNGYGIYDMAGNVAQWCFNWKAGNLPTQRVFRGGCWSDYAGYLRCGFPSYAVPTTMSNGIGFRCARNVPQ